MAVEPSGGSSFASSPVKRDKSLGNGKFCHQCRQNRDFVAACKNQRNNRPCSVKLCSKCLLNRYGEKAEEVATFDEWSCPKCRGICNCSVCMKRRGHQPTGILIKAAKATGFSSVSEMLLKSAEHANHENVGAVMSASLEKEVVFSPSKRGKENSFAGKLDANLPKSVDKNSKNVKRNRLGETSNGKVDKVNKKNTSIHVDEKKPKKSRREGLDENGDGLNLQNAEFRADSPLPVGTDLTSVAEIDICAEDAGNALQFLEFCSVFGKILDVRKGEAECVLQDLLHGRTARRGKFSLPVQFHMRLLSIIQTDRRGKCAAPSPSYGKKSWFHSLKKCLSESQHILKVSGMNSLEKATDYETLSASEKLRVLNHLCDEVLRTEKLRNWIDQQNSQFRKKVKEAKQKHPDAKDKENSLKQKMKDDIAKAIIAGDDARPSISGQEAIASRSKSEAAQAHAQLLESKDMLFKCNRTSDAMRIEPIFIEHRGHVYWKLNCYGKSDVLHQNVGNGDTLTLDEKWFTLDAEGKEVIEKYISSSKRK